MNKEKYNQIIDKAYENYSSKQNEYWKKWLTDESQIKKFDDGLSKEEFVNKIKTDNEFSERWGLKIEERELSLDEKEWELEKTHCINDIENDRVIYGHDWETYIKEQYDGIQSTQGIVIPTKLITLTYNNETTQFYE